MTVLTAETRTELNAEEPSLTSTTTPYRQGPGQKPAGLERKSP
jgi:hypothetical protein